jgi:arylsulfatase
MSYTKKELNSEGEAELKSQSNSMFYPKLPISWAGLLIFAVLFCITSVVEAAKRPNIVLIVGDDIGYSDAGSYGGEISTPNIDALAVKGIKLTNYRTAASCSPTRSMLLTGVDNHRSGLGQMLELLSDNQKGKPGYEGILNNKVVTIASLLQDGGYNTYMVGKWHLGGAEEGHGQPPHERGFDQTFALLEGASDKHSNRGFSPIAPISHFSRNGKDIKNPFEYYSAKTYTDTMIDFIEKDRKNGKPFFSYMAFTAAHAPLQAPQEYIDKYISIYEKGWDVIRAERFKKMQAMGLIPDYLELPPRWINVEAWDSQSKKEKRTAAKIMAVYSAMVDYMDMSIGRFIDYLKEIGEYENTVIVYFTDNGPDGDERNIRADYQQWFKEIGVDNSYENLGKPNSFIFRAANWAQVSNTPYWSEKSTNAEGGVIAQCIFSYPGVIPEGAISNAFLSVLDITPTLLDYAGVTHPGTSFKGREIHPMDGRSARPLLEGWQDRIYGENEPISFEVFGTVNKAIYLGDWKALKMGIAPYADANVGWKLFNMRMDPTEQKDLADLYPKQLDKMVAMYNEYEAEVGFVPANPE